MCEEKNKHLQGKKTTHCTKAHRDIQPLNVAKP